MRDYTRFDEYLDQLYQDIYPQPEDVGHTEWAEDAISSFLSQPLNISTVLDVGCGTGFCYDKLNSLGFTYVGVTASYEDYHEAKRHDRNVTLGDMTYLRWPEDSIDLIFARHVLEHSPFPIITLMEWWRVSKKYLFLIAPAPDYWQYIGKNHYSMANWEQLNWWLSRSGWKIDKAEILTTKHDLYSKHNPTWSKNNVRDVEYRLLCRKVEPIKE